MAKTPLPKPVVVSTICSMCGLDWDLHGDEPTAEDCVRLLKAEVVKKPTCGCNHHWHWWYQWYQPTITTPYVQPLTVWSSSAPQWQQLQNNTTAAAINANSYTVTNSAN